MLTALPSGEVLASGGATPATGGGGAITGALELFEPATNLWESIGSATPRKRHGAVVLVDGRVLLAAGGSAVTEALTPDTIDPRAFPSLNPVVGDIVAGQPFTLTGTRLTGVVDLASGYQATPEGFPLLSGMSLQTGAVRLEQVDAFDAGSLSMSAAPRVPGFDIAWPVVNGAAGSGTIFKVVAGAGAPCADSAICASGTCTAGSCAALVVTDAGVTDGGAIDGGRSIDAGFSRDALRVGCDCDQVPLWSLASLIAVAIGVRRRSRRKAFP